MEGHPIEISTIYWKKGPWKSDKLIRTENDEIRIKLNHIKKTISFAIIYYTDITSKQIQRIFEGIQMNGEKINTSIEDLVFNFQKSSSITFNDETHRNQIVLIGDRNIKKASKIYHNTCTSSITNREKRKMTSRLYKMLTKNI